MEKIESFKVNHQNLKRGIYVSRKDKVGENIVTTFDIRMKEPNKEPVMNTAEIHTLEHLGATFLRNDKVWGSRTIYFGPMGCRTGFYAIFTGDLFSLDVVKLITEMFKFCAEFQGEVPGADPVSCGNYQDMDLLVAKKEAGKFLDEILKNIKKENMCYRE